MNNTSYPWYLSWPAIIVVFIFFWPAAIVLIYLIQHVSNLVDTGFSLIYKKIDVALISGGFFCQCIRIISSYCDATFVLH